MNSRWLFMRSRSARGVARVRTYPKRISAVELLAACGQVDAGEWVADRFGGAHGDAADRVDKDGEPVEPDLGVVVEPQSGGLLDGLRQQRGAADAERGVDLVAAVAGDRHIGVARDGHHRGRRAGSDGGDVHKQDGVGAAVADVASGGQLGLLFGGQVLAAVRPDEKPRGALTRGGALGIVGQRGHAVQRAVHPDTRCDRSDDDDEQERQHDGAPTPFAARLFHFRWRPAVAVAVVAGAAARTRRLRGGGAAVAAADGGGVGGLGGHGGR